MKSIINSKYGVDVDWVLQRDDITDHHSIVECIAQEAEAEAEVVRTIAIEQYIRELSDQFDPLIIQIETAIA